MVNKNLQGQRLHSLPGQPVPRLTFLRPKTFLKSSLNPSSSHLCLLSLIHTPCASLMNLLLFSGSPGVYQELLLLRVPPKTSHLLAESAPAAQPHTTGQVLQFQPSWWPSILTVIAQLVFKDTGEGSVKSSAKMMVNYICCPSLIHPDCCCIVKGSQATQLAPTLSTAINSPPHHLLLLQLSRPHSQLVFLTTFMTI